MGESIATGGGFEVSRDWGSLLRGTGFLFGVMEMFWNWTVMMWHHITKILKTTGLHTLEW